jgi:choline dehydrogenase-like flavoprotein
MQITRLSGSVLDANQHLFISDGSQFTTGAAENPTLTIVALALRQADHIVSLMSKREI